jgi:hypothetical protein
MTLMNDRGFLSQLVAFMQRMLNRIRPEIRPQKKTGTLRCPFDFDASLLTAS